MKLNYQNTEDQLNAELEQAKGRAPGPEVYESILREVVERAGADQKLSYAAGLQRVEAIRRREHKRRSRLLVGVSCAAVAACFGLYFMPLAPNVIYPTGDEFVQIEDTAPPLAALPEGILPVTEIEGELAVELVELADGELTLRLSGYPDNVNWLTAYGEDPDGVMYFPRKIDPQQGLITFEHPENNLTVHLSDTFGNAIF